MREADHADAAPSISYLSDGTGDIRAAWQMEQKGGRRYLLAACRACVLTGENRNEMQALAFDVVACYDDFRAADRALKRGTRPQRPAIWQ